MGHKNIKTTMDVYSHLLDEIEQKEKIKAVKLLENMTGRFDEFRDVNRYFMKSRGRFGDVQVELRGSTKINKIYNKTPSNQRFVLRFNEV